MFQKEWLTVVKIRVINCSNDLDLKGRFTGRKKIQRIWRFYGKENPYH
uniref:Uncharacterized protein n=1 Tax=Anguilla anguilla TaxID=7936 RepID=A0A0E9WC60_ANGAN